MLKLHYGTIDLVMNLFTDQAQIQKVHVLVTVINVSLTNQLDFSICAGSVNQGSDLLNCTTVWLEHCSTRALSIDKV